MRRREEALLRTLRSKRTLGTLTGEESAIFARLGQKKREEGLVMAQRFTSHSAPR